jgi:hypothetical protein
VENGGAVKSKWTYPLSLLNCTLVGNTAQGHGAVFAFNGATVDLKNCIAWNNGDTPLVPGDGGKVNVAHSCVQGGWDGEAIVDDDPLFQNASEGVFALQRTSPCMDVGDDTAICPDLADIDGDGDLQEPTPLDLDGEPRFSRVVDMGAHEFQLKTSQPAEAK